MAMWIQRDFAHSPDKRDTAITIGSFDGVHRGHQALIRRMVTHAQETGLKPIVITFDPLPGQVLMPDEYKLLSTLEERAELIESLGVVGLIALPFDETVRNMSAEVFIRQLATHLGIKALWIGPDFRLGRNREGDAELLHGAGHRYGFDLHIHNEVITWQGKPVHSSRIRAALREGRIDEANGCLGYPYRLSGIVEEGNRRGRILGFPTANVAVPRERLLPRYGVYLCQARLGDQALDAIVNVGRRPTFDNGSPTVEAHLLDFNGDLYQRTLRLEFLAWLRPERKFASVVALTKQLQRDRIEARRRFQMLRERGKAPSLSYEDSRINA
ncbi:MAG TPA: bifunctional riboflavin kinase/FAD synthetase [Chloroflexi bacterium]|nr:bifunctional riboflavin kinase/FAD synthetase [Chloroflexota bacterium]